MIENNTCALESANWISGGSSKPFYARKTFRLSERPVSAVITVCGLGQFNLYINGSKVSDDMLDPAWTDYNRNIMYLEFDVAGMLKSGENVIACEVGNGWFIMDRYDKEYSFHFPEFMPPNPNHYIPFGDMLILNVCLKAELRDTSNIVIRTDDSWKVRDHMVICSNVYGSEVIDGALRDDLWNTLSCDESAWRSAVHAEAPKGRLEKQTIPSVKVTERFNGKMINKTGDRVIYDFGTNASGMLELEVRGKAGQTVKVFPAEKLAPDGNVDQMAKNWMDINVEDIYKIEADDTWEKFEMKFTYICARFIAIEGCDENNIRNVRCNAITSCFENAGSFACDDKRFLQIYDLISRAVESNMLSVHTDCPTIERFAWQEENHLMAPSVMYMKKAEKHWIKFLEDARLAQHTKDDSFNDMHGGRYYPGDGLIPSQAPCYIPNVIPVPGLGDFYDIIGWGSSIILGTDWVYEFYGNSLIIEDNYEAGCRYFAHLKTKLNEHGFINHGLGDWGNPEGIYAKENIETAFLYADAIRLAKFAKILKMDTDAERYTEEADAIRKNYNEKLLTFDAVTGRYCYRVWSEHDLTVTPAAEALPLYFGICPDEMIADVSKTLAECVAAAGSFRSGEVGQPYIIQMLSEYGYNDLITECILSPKHPSYYAFVLDGETSLGEYWETNPRSHCHDMMGHIAEWYYNGIAGIKRLAPGFKKVLIKPYLPKQLDHVKCAYDSASGRIEVELIRINGKTELSVNADKNIEVTVDRSFLI